MAAMSCCAQSDQKEVLAVDGTILSKTLLDAKIDSIVSTIDMPGLSIAIVNDSEMVYHNTFGVTNKETKQPVDEQTIF